MCFYGRPFINWTFKGDRKQYHLYRLFGSQISLQRFCDFCLRFCRSHFDYNICIDIKKYTCVWYIPILPLPPPTCTHLILLKFYIWYILILPLPHPTCTHLILLKFYIKELETTYECIWKSWNFPSAIYSIFRLILSCKCCLWYA